jgi:hypothetical protein
MWRLFLYDRVDYRLEPDRKEAVHDEKYTRNPRGCANPFRAILRPTGVF